MIRMTDRISLDEDEIEENFVRASGPGGQNVNKVSSAVQMRFNVVASPNLTPYVKERLIRLAGKRMTNDGVLVISAQRHRTQERNRADALERLAALITQAAEPVIQRRPTRPTNGSRLRRLAAKETRGKVKALRRAPDAD
ncbi:MAG: Class peptide chain release factor [Hyphomicrobiales bacterium]|nr:Class peptide chain release factor [Hyphomicrobiales bacterium]